MSRAGEAVRLAEEWLRGARVLEVACGSADFARAATQIAARVDAVDLSDTRLPETLKGVHFHIMDAARMAFADGAFDIAVLYNAAAHLADFDAVLAECRRVARHVLIIASWKIDKAFLGERFPVDTLRRSGEFWMTML